MINQTDEPVNRVDLLYSMRVMLFTVFLLMDYELSRPNPSGNREEYDLLLPDAKQESPGISLWQKKASEKAVARYAAAQEKKWHHWNEAMFERSD